MHPTTRLRSLGAVACLVLAPVLEIVAIAVAPSESGDGAAQLSAIAADRDTAMLALALELLALALLAGAVLGLASLLTERLPGWATVGGALGLVGLLDIAIMDAKGLVASEMVVGGADRAQMAALVDRLDASAVTSALQIGSLLQTVGLIVLAVGLVRATRIPAWAAGAIAVGAVVETVGFATETPALAAAGFAVVLVGFLPAAARLSGRGVAVAPGAAVTR